MSAKPRHSARILVVLSAAIVTVGCATTPASAQQPYPQQPYPQQPAPAGTYPAAAPPPQQYATPPKPNPIRELFVGTLSAVLQGATGALAGTLVQGVTGSITNWFAKKSGNPNFAVAYPQGAAPTDPYATANPGVAYPGTPYPQASNPYPAGAPTTTDPYATAPAPAYPQQPTDPYATAPAPAYPQATDPYATSQAPASPYGTTPADPYAATATQYYDPQTGQTGSATAYGYAGTTSGYDGTLYAGLAYEVHALLPDGRTMPVNAAVHEFRTGDKFMVHFRPSLPGRLDVFNINPLGVQTRIDSVEMAAGQLSSLGPYQFAATKGDEALRLVLSPCSTPQLLTATRDIINVSGNAPASGGTSFNSCGVVGRSVDKGRVKTRDIQKVAVDGTTSFALDPVSQAEYSSGSVDSREVTIVFRHR